MANFRDYIETELTTRRKQNANYSLRAFARDLGMAPSKLSELLSGKAGISTMAARRIAEVLKLSAEEASHFVNLVEFEHGRSAETRKLAEGALSDLSSNQPYQAIDLERFKVLGRKDKCRKDVIVLFYMTTFMRRSGFCFGFGLDLLILTYKSV